MSVFWQVFQLFVMYNLFVSCNVSSENDFNESKEDNAIKERESENLVLDSVYDAMKHNYEEKLRQDLEKLNIISDIRNKRNVNEPIDYYKNHQFEIVNRKSPETFPLGFKNPPKLIPLTNPNSLRRSEYYDEDVR